MIHLLAQFAAVEPSQLGNWLITLFAILGAVNQGAGLIGRFREQPPAHERYATKSELAAVKAIIDGQREEFREEIAGLSDKLDSFYQETIKAGESRATKIHNRVNDIGGVVQETRGEIKQLGTQIALLISQAVKSKNS